MKVYLTQINESWIIDKIRSEFYINFPDITTNKIKNADIVWVIAPWLSNKIKTRQLKNKKVLVTLSKQLDAWLTQKGATWQPKYPIRKEDGMSAGRPPKP